MNKHELPDDYVLAIMVEDARDLFDKAIKERDGFAFDRANTQALLSIASSLSVIASVMAKQESRA